MKATTCRNSSIVFLFCGLTQVAFAQTYSETVLHNFQSPPNGYYPLSGVTLDAAGNLYGTTLLGGAANQGVFYRVDPTGSVTVLHSFTGGADGEMPYGGVVLDSAGNLYGASSGGSTGQGTVFKIDPTGNLTVLHSFSGGSDGGEPCGGLALDGSRNLYGATSLGTVFKIDASGQETVLHHFGGRIGGCYAWAGVSLDGAGHLYGTTMGARNTSGVVYRLSLKSNKIVLYTLNRKDGAPTSGVARDSSGNLYGTASSGGRRRFGMVYKVDTTGHETVLYNFKGGVDGKYPDSGVVLDSAGSLYGTTSEGAAFGGGAVYKLSATGSLTVLHAFTGLADGAYPVAGVTLDSSGNLYGTTTGDGYEALGTIFKIDASGNESVIYNFGAASDGTFPRGLTLDGSGNLYGTTSRGGPAGAGVVFKIDSTGSEVLLQSFTGGADGGTPEAGVIFDASGNLYGTTRYGGGGSCVGGCGVVFRLDAEGNLTTLYRFSGGADGAWPMSGLMQDSAGNLYGTTERGGSANTGVIYKLDPSGNETVLHSFGGLWNPGGLVEDSAGNLYGATSFGGVGNSGMVYKVDASGTETVVHHFGGSSDVAEPSSDLIIDPAGNLYGLAHFGGAYAQGGIYKITPGGSETVIYSFSLAEGPPESPLIRDLAGNLYGATSNIAFELSAAGTLTTLYYYPFVSSPYQAVLALDHSGKLYGACGACGPETVGAVYELQPTAASGPVSGEQRGGRQP